jgi:NADPH:quinone reductase-like Zn-dependent oxidoreductase
MNSIQISDNGGLDNLNTVTADTPSPAAGQVLVRWHASSLNFHDYLVAKGAIPVPEGRVPMSDGAGIIEAIGEGVSKWQVGDKVMSLFFPNWHDGIPNLEKTSSISGETTDGFATEYSVQSEQSLTSIPRGYSYAQAATLPCAALTAWRGLVVEGNIKAGDSVLVEGTGGMSIFALQMAKAAGAYVYATTSSDAKIQRLKDLGADEVINYKEDERWGRTIYKTSGGVDHVLDVGGTSTIAQSIEAVAIYGNISLIGILGGREASMVMPKLFFKHVHLNGLAVGSRVMQEDMVSAIDVAGWKPVIDKSFTLAELGDAFRYQESGNHFGKIVVEF